MTDADLPTPGPLTDGVLSLVLVAVESAATSFWKMPAYRFGVIGVSDGARVGHLNLRVSNDDGLTRFFGHIGYAVDVPHRGHGYAARACRVVLPFAAACGIDPLWITCGPDNPASRRTLENLGAELVEIVPVPADYPLTTGADRRKCRYRLPVTPRPPAGSPADRAD